MFTLISVIAIATALAAASVWIYDGAEAEDLPSRRYNRRQALVGAKAKVNKNN